MLGSKLEDYSGRVEVRKIWMGHGMEWKKERKGLFCAFEDPTK